MLEAIEAMKAREAPAMIHPMEYLSIPVPGEAAEAAGKGPRRERGLEERVEERVRVLEQELDERSSRFESGLKAARAEAFEAGRVKEREEHTARGQAAYEALKAGLAAFEARRDEYLAEVEREVVRLALSIAQRVLHRESLMDPLLLAGAVRVALGQLAESSKARLRVPSEEHAMWEEMLRLMPNLPLRPEVFADPALGAGDCLLEAEAGTVDLGVKSQLAEIERGFFDLLDRREKRSAVSGQRSEEPEGGEGRNLEGRKLEDAEERNAAAEFSQPSSRAAARLAR